MKTIQIIEDDQNSAKALAIRLKSAGYEATLVPGAITEVDVTLKFQPDLALLICHSLREPDLPSRRKSRNSSSP